MEGNSIRGTQRLTGVNRRTIIRLIREVGQRCNDYLDKELRYLRCESVEADELWTMIKKAQRRLTNAERNNGSEYGHCYVFTAIDADTKLIITHSVGRRTEENAFNFIADLRKRIIGKFQLTTDAFNGYANIDTVGFRKRISYAQIIKVYRSNQDKKESYSPSEFIGIRTSIICGKPDITRISTSYVERQSLTMRTQMRRFTRLTNAFSKKLDCLTAFVAIYFWHYNFVRGHRSLRRSTPAMEAGIAKTFLDWNVVL